jgi:hypothetical protein
MPSIGMLIGWPAIALAVALVVVGLVRRRRAPLVVAALLILPICAYLAATPRFPFYPLLMPLLLGTSAWALPRSPRVALGLVMPVAGFVLYLTIAVLTQ